VINLRKGFGRIYTLLAGVVLLGICIAGILEMPTASEVDRSYAYEVKKLIPKGGQSENATLQDTCNLWSDFSTEVKALCDGREIRLRDLPSKQSKHIVERLMYLVGAAAVLYAIRRAVRWIADGFGDKSQAN